MFAVQRFLVTNSEKSFGSKPNMLESQDTTIVHTIIWKPGLIKVTPTSFTKSAKCQISAQFFIRMYVLGWYTYFEASQVLFSLCFREKGGQNSDNL